MSASTRRSSSALVDCATSCSRRSSTSRSFKVCSGSSPRSAARLAMLSFAEAWPDTNGASASDPPDSRKALTPSCISSSETKSASNSCAIVRPRATVSEWVTTLDELHSQVAPSATESTNATRSAERTRRLGSFMGPARGGALQVPNTRTLRPALRSVRRRPGARRIFWAETNETRGVLDGDPPSGGRSDPPPQSSPRQRSWLFGPEIGSIARRFYSLFSAQLVLCTVRSDKCRMRR